MLDNLVTAGLDLLHQRVGTHAGADVPEHHSCTLVLLYSCTLTTNMCTNSLIFLNDKG